MSITEFSELFPSKFVKTISVNQLVYKNFQDCSGDLNPLHTNEEFAISKGFKGKVMYGNILNAFISYFVGECLPTKEVIIHSQTINFKLPVYLNDNLNMEFAISELHESVNAIEFKYHFKNESDKIVAKGNIQIGLLK